MMFKQPQLKKIKRQFRRQLKTSFAKKGSTCFGSLGLQALEAGFISSKILELVSQNIARSSKRGAKVWFRCFPDYPVTSKPSEVRMGKGKGQIKHWAAKLNKGSVFLEVSGINLVALEKTLQTVQSKLPIKTKLIRE